jgi:hypothetical protein
MFFDQIYRIGNQIERDGLMLIRQESLPERLNSRRETSSALKRHVHHRALLNAPGPVFPAECNVHDKIKGTE